jgi:hypothetical protein
MEIDRLLENLRLSCTTGIAGSESIASAIEAVLIWLNYPTNNTNDNCRKVDFFVMSRIITNSEFDNLSEDIRAIIFDMGGTLHDTHTAPEVAKNFESTPEQLLGRIQKLIKSIENRSI